MTTIKRLMVISGVGFWLFAGCAVQPQPFCYHPDNELKPGPGIFTGRDGAYTIYGPPAAAEDKDLSVEDDPVAPGGPAAR